MKNKSDFIVVMFTILFTSFVIMASLFVMDANLTKIENNLDDIQEQIDAIPTAYAEEVEARACPASEVPEEIKSNCTSLGEFYLTAYCGCEICCGEWANNRPDGKVYGASGRELIPNYSIAVDPDVIPLGTVVRIGGKEYRADDTGGMIEGNRIDVYFTSHEEALNFKVGNYQVDIWE